jgi:hypothetical protein
MLDPFENPYPKGMRDNPGVVTDSMLLTPSLTSSINDKGDIMVNMRSKNVYTTGNERGKSLSDIDCAFKIFERDLYKHANILNERKLRENEF